jgi:hypothetical protein
MGSSDYAATPYPVCMYTYIEKAIIFLDHHWLQYLITVRERSKNKKLND